MFRAFIAVIVLNASAATRGGDEVVGLYGKTEIPGEFAPVPVRPPTRDEGTHPAPSAANPSGTPTMDLRARMSPPTLKRRRGHSVASTETTQSAGGDCSDEYSEECSDEYSNESSDESCDSESSPDAKRRQMDPDAPITWRDFAKIVFWHPCAVPADVVAAKLPWPACTEPTWPDTLRPRFKSFVVKQLREDLQNRLFAPSLSGKMDNCENTRVGRLCFAHRPLAVTETSTIQSVTGNDSIVVKYQMDGIEADKMVHPLLIDFWFLKIVEPFGISPKPLAVSPPAAMVHVRSWKGNFGASKEDLAVSVSDSATIRYSVMERVGESLQNHMEAHPDKRLSLRKSLLIGIEIIKLLRKLHEEVGIVHGDIHAGNVCFRSNANDTDLVLIDYGRAFFIADHEADESVRPSGSWNHALFTPWELDGFFPGRRDDVFRAMLVIATLINGAGFNTLLNNLESDLEAARAFKSSSNFFFSLTPSRNSLQDPRVGVSEAARVETALQWALENTRSVVSTAHRPNYEAIVSNFEEALSLLPA